MRMKSTAAMLMIWMIIMLPLYSSSVMADITDVKTYDENNVPGFMRSGGMLSVEAYARISGDDNIDTNQLKLGSISFNECKNPDPDYRFQCFLTIPTAGFSLTRPVQTYSLTLYDDDDYEIDTSTASITIDDLIPVVTSLQAPTLVGRGEFQLEYSVRDPVDASNGCSGIAAIKVYFNDNLHETIDINSTSCQKSGVIPLLGTDLEDGVNQIEVSTVDMLAHESTKAGWSLTAELSEVSVYSIEIIDVETGQEMRWYDPGVIMTQIWVTFDGPAIEEDSIQADFSELSGNTNDIYNTDACTSSEGQTLCRFEPVEVTADSSRTATIYFDMEDYAGNSIQVSKSVQVKVDTTGPTTTAIRSNTRGDDGVDYVGMEEGGFTATITENALLDPTKIRLHLGNLELGNQEFSVTATSCNNISYTTWQCDFTDISTVYLDEGEYQAFILKDSTDHFDNYFTNDYSVDFVMDNIPPELIDVKVEIIGETDAVEDRDYIQIGDFLKITATIAEDNAISNASVDLHQIIFDQYDMQGSCSGSDGIWTCIWVTDKIDLAEYTQANIPLHIKDGGGNILYHELFLEVFAVEEVGETIWVAKTGGMSPTQLDRQMVTFYQPSIWHIWNLIPQDPEVIPIDVYITECYDIGDSDTSAVDYLYDAPIVYNYNSFDTSVQPSYNMYTKSTLIQAAPEDNSLEFNCTIMIVGLKDGTTIMHSPAIDITLPIAYFNNPIGTVDDNVETEIDRVKDSWLVQAEWIGSLKTILDYGNMICGLITTYNQVMTIFAVLSDVLKGTCSSGIGASSCPFSAAMGGKTVASKVATTELYETAEPYCAMLNCKYSKNEETDKSGDLMGYANMVTGNADYVGNMKGEGKDRNAWLGNLDASPKNSLLLSILYLCLPGVIYNLQKARAIDCVYINCLKDVKDGMPISLCTSQRGYAYCKFVFGEIFHLIPFASAISSIAQNVQKALSHPAEFIGFVVKGACTIYCSQPAGPPLCSACSIAEFMNMMLDVLCDLGIGGEQCEAIWDGFGVEEDACEEALSD